MPLLSEPDRKTVTARLSTITHHVTLLLFTQTIGAPESALIAKQIVDEVASLSDLVSTEEVNVILDRDRAAGYGIDRSPAVVLLRDGEDTRIRFLGAPEGYEFSSLIEGVVLAGTGESGLSADSRSAIATRATSPIDVKVFVTPTCPHCPRMVTLAHRMAVESPQIVATCVEATDFLDLAQQYKVTGVPKTVVEGTTIEILGAIPEDQFVNTILSGIEGR